MLTKNEKYRNFNGIHLDYLYKTYADISQSYFRVQVRKLSVLMSALTFDASADILGAHVNIYQEDWLH